MSDTPELQGPPRRGGPGQRHHSDRGQGEDAALRANRALELRTAGATYDAIAQALQYGDRSTAAKAVQRALDRDYARTEGLRDEYRMLHLGRIERAIRGIWSKVVHGDLGAIDRLVRLLERESRLLGLDEPQAFAVASAESIERAESLVTDIMEQLHASAATAAENEAIRAARLRLSGNGEAPDEPFAE